MYTRAHTCTVCIYTYTYICVHIHMHVYVHTCTYTRTCVRIHIHICVYIYIYTYVCVIYTYTYMCIHVHIHVHIHIHVRVCTYTYTCIHPPPNSPLIQATMKCWAEFPVYTVGPCWLSILNTAECTCWSQTPWLSLLPILPPGNHKFIFLSLWGCFCFAFINKFICAISFWIPPVRDGIQHVSLSV